MVLAFDPGITTGWAFYSSRFDHYRYGQLNDDLPNLYKFLNQAKPRTIVYEDFKHRATMIKSEMYSLQVIGVIRLWAQQNYVPTYKYLPAEIKAFWDDKKLHTLGLWGPGQGHAMDAIRVLLTHKNKTEPKWRHEVLRKLNV